jgi:hypothetical protein
LQAQKDSKSNAAGTSTGAATSSTGLSFVAPIHATGNGTTTANGSAFASVMTSQEGTYTGASISIKCFFTGGDNRVIEVPRDINLKDLSLRIQLKYGKPVIVQYEDADGDKITIDSPEILAKAMAQFDRLQTYKFFLLPKGGAAATGSGVAGGMNVDNTMGGNSNWLNGAGFNHVQQESKHALIDELKYTTKFNKHDLEKLYAHFQKVASKGRLNKKQFENGLRYVSARLGMSQNCLTRGTAIPMK